MTLSNEIYYKGFTGTIDYCNQDNILYGKVIAGVPKGTLIMYHGDTIEECKAAFQDLIDSHTMDESYSKDIVLSA
ncbi:MAG: hypothetical protein FWB80_02650 [Defluviitaleaceae bacterium]|nr:hypothetical protein [Defluviitaleaceae bacterium]